MAIFTSIAIALGASGIWIGITAAALEVASGIALSLLAKAISGANSQGASQFGVQGTLQAGGDIERSFIAGFGATAGSLVYANEWGNVNSTPNAYHTQVICVSDLPVAGANAAGLAQLFVNGDLATINWGASPTAQGYPVTDYNKDGADHLWVKFYDGTQTTADSFLTGTVASADRPYGSTRVGTGCAYVILTALVNDGLFNGFPTFRFGLNGTKLYDISKDTTAGGSGSHRWATPATWGGDGDNLPAVQAYNILRGITFAGAWFYGLQSLPAARLPNAAWIAAIGKCRTPITGVSGPEPTYRSGGEIGINATIADTITTLLTTCQGSLAETGGIYKMHLGAPDSPVFSLDDYSILSTEAQTFTPFFGLADTINGITAKYPDPAQGWNSTVAPPLYSPDDEASDGNRRLLADVSLDFVPYAAQAQRLMKSALLSARQARRHTIVVGPEFWFVEPGDYGEFTSLRNGYSSKLFRVDGVSDKGNLDVILDITEVDPDDYDWTHATDFKTPVDGSIVIQRPTAQAVVGFTVSPAIVFDTSGAARRPTIQVMWNGDQPDVAAVLWEVRLKSTALVVATGQIDDVAAGAGILPAGPYLPNETYQVRLKYKPFSQRDTLWSSWLDVTTANILLGPDDIAALAITIGKLSQDLQNVKGLVTGTDAGSIPAAIDELRKLIADQSSVAVTDQTTNLRKTDALIVQQGKNSAVVAEDRQARVDADNALASLVDDVSATVDDISAGGLFSVTAEAGIGGATTTIALRALAAAGLTKSSVGLLMLASADGFGGTTADLALQTGRLFVVDALGNVSTAMTFNTATGKLTAVSIELGAGAVTLDSTGLTVIG